MYSEKIFFIILQTPWKSLSFIQNMLVTRRMMSVFNPSLFTDHVAVVTGGGTGIGKAITTELACLGCNVVISSRKLQNLEKSSQEINAKVGRELVHPIKCNIRDENEVKNLMEETVSRLGKFVD